MNLRQIIYDTRERFNLESDDTSITNRYIEFLIERAREFIIDQRYSDPRNIINESMLQSLHVNIGLNGESEINIPSVIKTTGFTSSSFKAYGVKVAGTMLDIPMNVVPIDRLPYVGENKFTHDKIYCAMDSDGKIILNSKNNLYKLINKILIKGVFSNPREVFEMEHPGKDFMDAKYPISDSVLAKVIEIVDDKLQKKLNYNKDIINNGTEDRQENS